MKVIKLDCYLLVFSPNEKWIRPRWWRHDYNKYPNRAPFIDIHSCVIPPVWILAEETPSDCKRKLVQQVLVESKRIECHFLATLAAPFAPINILLPPRLDKHQTALGRRAANMSLGILGIWVK